MNERTGVSMEDGQEYDIGMVGAGTMGGNFARNIADHGFSMAVYDTDAAKAREVEEGAPGGRIRAARTLQELVGLLRKPRAILMLVPAGPPVDAVIRELVPWLKRGDVLIDGGNSHFTDTNRRVQQVTEQEILFMGMGISGGERGARHGPSLMPGGPREAYERVRPILEAATARVNGDPCVTYLGSGSAGHYVKMVHNGIEYGLMELLAETYDVMKRGLGMDPDALADVYARWNGTELNSYLLEITSTIFHARDEEDPSRLLIDQILDRARQKGTGKWTSWDAMELRVPTPTIDAAVMMRNLSGHFEERRAVAGALTGPAPRFEGEAKRSIERLRKALYAGMILTYAQGMALLKAASAAYDYGLSLGAVAGIWRGGCIIRAALLEEIRRAYQGRPELSNLMVDEHLSGELASRQEDLRAVVQAAVEHGLPVPGFAASLAYFDAYRSAWLPANLIQAQRDFFGAHTYERRDMPGKVFHTVWSTP